ncbi:MAG TPA: hypothetical protein VL614_15260 [Acetobacteraceae bacterium]|jgi:hypothetical protein|nr:hypothetical protein [Acetobacteraceae bacterium]
MTRPGGILALDISLSTGWALGHPHSNDKPAGGVWKLGTMKDRAGNLQLGYLGSCMMNQVETVLYSHAPVRVVFESPVSKAQTTDRLLKYLCGAVEIACFEAGVPCFEVGAPTARAMVLGRGTFPRPWKGEGKWVMRKVRGSKTDEKQKVLVGDAKQEVGIWCQEQGLNPTDDNHADALLLLRYACIMAKSRVTAGAGSVWRSDNS